VVASAITKGTSSIRASVCAKRVLPEPVGPISKILLFANSTPSTIALAGNLDSLIPAVTYNTGSTTFVAGINLLNDDNKIYLKQGNTYAKV
jgi:hypothetical protein